MKDHYAGSIAYDNHMDVWEDQAVMAFSFDELVEDMKELMTRRRNSEVFFAAKIVNGKEIDITERVRVAVQ